MSEVQVKLTLVDQITRQSTVALTAFRRNIMGVVDVAKQIGGSFDARAMATPIRGIKAATQAMAQFGATLNELAPDAEKFKAAFSEDELRKINDAAASFNRLGASWDKFLGHVIASSPVLNRFFDDLDRRLKQVTFDPAKAVDESVTLAKTLLDAQKDRDQYLSKFGQGSFDNPNSFHKAMVDGIKKSLAEAEAAYADWQKKEAQRVADYKTMVEIGHTLAARSVQEASDNMVAATTEVMGPLFDAMESFADGEAIVIEFAHAWDLAGKSMEWAEVQAAKVAARSEDVADSLRGLRDIFQEVSRFERDYWQEMWDDIDAIEQEREDDRQAFLDAVLAMDIDRMNEQARAMREIIEESNRKAQEFAREAASIMTNNVMQFFDALITGSENAGRAFTRMIAGMLSDFGRMQMSKALTSVFGSLFGGGGVADAGETGDIGAGFGVYSSGHASGGNIRAGMPVMVGERGPELFVPSSSGNVVTAGRSGAGGGIGSVVINVNGAQDPTRTAREIKSALSSLMANDPGARQMMRRAIA